MSRACARCPTTLGPRNKSGLCRRCGIRRSLEENPERLERVRATLRRNSSLPQATEARRRVIVSMRLWELGQAACPAGCEARRRGALRQSETKLAAIPPELRDDYRLLVRKTKLPAAVIRDIILAQHEADMTKFRRSIGA